MENTNWIGSLILAIAILVAGYFVSNTLKIGKAYDRTVQVKGLAEREVRADLAVWPINITVSGNDLKLIKNDIEMQKKTVMTFFRNQGFDEDELNSGISNINDAHAEMYGNNQYREFRYTAKTDFTIRTSDINKLQKALEQSLELVSKGILISSKNPWRPIEYTFSGLNDLKPSMIEEATKNAREVAEKFAKDSNSKVGKIRSANQGLFTIYDRDENTPFIKIVRVVSTIDYQLED